MRNREARIELKVHNGRVLIGSDAHYWPGRASSAHKAFVEFAREYKPQTVIMNGDVIDASTISQYPPIGWEARPSMKEELEVAQARLAEVEAASKGSTHVWTLGNHDARFEKRLATVAPEFKGVHGIHLKDHFPRWHPAWSVEINNRVNVKHRFKGGTHAAYNNAYASGRSIVTGHLHSLVVVPYTDYNGTRYGVDGGTLADPLGPQFTGYTEDNPLNWRSGFVLLTFKNGRLLWPETIHVIKEGLVEFRGDTFNV